jgi:hypothetical protein
VRFAAEPPNGATLLHTPEAAVLAGRVDGAISGRYRLKGFLRGLLCLIWSRGAASGRHDPGFMPPFSLKGPALPSA